VLDNGIGESVVVALTVELFIDKLLMGVFVVVENPYMFVNDLLNALNGDGNGCDPVINVCLRDLLPDLPNDGDTI